MTALLESTAHLDGFVGADAAGDAERDESQLLLVDLYDLTTQDFLLRDRGLLVPFFPRHGAVEQLPCALAREDDEFEAILFRWSFHGFSVESDEFTNLRMYQLIPHLMTPAAYETSR